MNLTQIKKERAQKRKEQKQLKKAIQEANKDFFTNFFKHLNDEI
jgi:hypothetical protein